MKWNELGSKCHPLRIRKYELINMAVLQVGSLVTEMGITDSSFSSPVSYQSRVTRFCVDRATSLQPCEIMLLFFYYVLFRIFPYGFLPRFSLILIMTLRILFIMKSAWHLVTPFIRDLIHLSLDHCFVLLSKPLTLYHFLTLLFSICHRLTLLAILNLVLGVLITIRKLICWLNISCIIYSSTASNHVQYHYASLPCESEPVFVSYISSEKELAKSREKLPAENSSENSDFWNDLRLRENKLYFEDELEGFDHKDDFILISGKADKIDFDTAKAFTAYKKVDRKIKPVSGTFPQDALVKRRFPHDPLVGLTVLSKNPPNFVPTKRITEDRLNQLDINPVGFLWPEEEKLFIQVLLANENALAFEETDRGTLREDYFSPYIMPTIPHTAWEERNIPIPPGIKDKVIELLKHKMDAGVYEHCQSAYRSKWFCVLKKSGKLRIVHDLQALNAVSIRDAGGPPILDDFVEPFAGRQCYTVFDLFWGFDARRVHPDSRDLTAFATPLGLLRLTSMPMGYTNSPAEFQKCMVFILRDEIPDVANIFIDDLPIKGPTSTYPDKDGNPETLKENSGIRRFVWEHAVDVNRVMHRVKQSGATFSVKKLQICLPEVLIVGTKCTPAGRLPDDMKVEKILNWPTLKTPSEARGFLGLCGTVRIWINGYSQLVRPLSELFHKDKEFEWTDRRQKAFEVMKKLVATAPALRSIDYTSDLPVILAVDTSNKAVGIVILQIDEEGKRRPARYGSIPLNQVEERYSQPKLELYGLYRALRAFRLYLIGVKNLIVEVDAKYIKGMLNAPDLQPNAAMNRWIQGILMFDFTLKHVPGKTHLAADALSRRSLGEGEQIVDDDDSWLDNISLYVGVADVNLFATSTLNDLSQGPLRYSPKTLPSYMFSGTIRLDENLKDIFKFLTTLEAPHSDSIQDQKRFVNKATQFFVRDGKMWKRRGKRPPLLVIMDHARRLAILTQAHESLGHRGEQAVFETVRERYYWPHLRQDVKHHVQSCHQCQVRSTVKMRIPITVSTPATIFTKVYVDVMDMTESHHGYKYIVCARDDLSRASEGRALKNNDSISLMHFFWEQIYC
jgi:hypothetical protein